MEETKVGIDLCNGRSKMDLAQRLKYLIFTTQNYITNGLLDAYNNALLLLKEKHPEVQETQLYHMPIGSSLSTEDDFPVDTEEAHLFAFMTEFIDSQGLASHTILLSILQKFSNSTSLPSSIAADD